MDLPARESLIRQIHDSGRQLVLAVAGGGSGAIGELLSVPGGSRSVIEAAVPYSAAALADYLRAKPDQFCSEWTARAMAMAAYVRGQHLGVDTANLVGIGCTASLASDRPKHGDHRVFVAWQTLEATAVMQVTLEKGRRTRAEEEYVTASLVLIAIANACGLAAPAVLPPSPRTLLPLTNAEPLKIARQDAPKAWQDLWSGRIPAIAHPWDSAAPIPSAPRAIFPGSFNPLHHGHQRMAEIASELLSSPVAFELSVFNVEKPPLDYLEVSQRVARFGAGQTVWLTRAARFVQKADLFPGATFIVGSDTIARIADAKYYGGDLAARDAALAQLAARGCRFLVFGRLFTNEMGSQFFALSDMALPDSFKAICREVPAATFREDVSSTGLRRPIL